MGQLIAGTCYVKVDGAQLTINGGCEAPLMFTKREPSYRVSTRKPTLPRPSR